MKIDLREENIDTKFFKNLQHYAGHVPTGHIPSDIPEDDELHGYLIILAHLSTYFNDSVIVELGTHKGHSAVGLAYNKTNEVYTYDIKYEEQAFQKFQNDEYENIEYIIRDCIKNNWQSQIDKETFLSSELIFLDVDPHDGIQENKVLDFLIFNSWKGIMVCDDIIGGANYIEGTEPNSLSATQMQNFWNNIELPKYDITDNKYAHYGGTGIVCFNNQEVIM